ncbi:MAG: hypothetical protein IH621_12055, partial [Krumholzibacteria bacterium]|nr:hypothetical protein [Candidatus Krumholzibacteria bacterium]
MNEHDRDGLDPQQRAARDAVRGLGVPAADPDFRARLKAQFVAGAVPEDATGIVHLPTRHLPVFAWGTLAAAAVVIWAVLGLNPLPGPELLAVGGTGVVVGDGQQFG